LLPENVDAVFIYCLVEGQVITAGADNRIIDINQMVVWKAIEKFEIEDQVGIFQKVVEAHKYFIIKDLEKKSV